MYIDVTMEAALAALIYDQLSHLILHSILKQETLKLSVNILQFKLNFQKNCSLY